MLTKEQFLERFASGDGRYDSFTWDEVRVRAYGDAVMTVGNRRRGRIRANTPKRSIGRR